MQKPLTVNHNKLWKTYRAWNTRPFYLPSEKSDAGQKATVRTEHGTTDWFQIGKGVHKDCILLIESIPRQIDRKSRGPQGERYLEFSRRKKGQTSFIPLHSLGLYNNKVSCLGIVSGKKPPG